MKLNISLRRHFYDFGATFLRGIRAGGAQANGVVECAIAAFNERKAAYLAADYKKSEKFLGAACDRDLLQ